MIIMELSVCSSQYFGHWGRGGICLGQLDRNIVLAFVCILAETQEHGTYLRLLYGGVVSITHGGDIHAQGPLLVSLLKELFHEMIHLHFVKLEWFGRVGQVGAVCHVL